jgi:phosphocarrier protein HPr
MNRIAPVPDLAAISAHADIVINHATGLHARPSVQLTRLAKSFAASIEISDQPVGPWHNAKSIVKVMALKVPTGTRLYIRAHGRDARDAVSALHALIETDFADAADERAN